MMETLLVTGVFALLPVVYLHGKRAGFERHQCLWVPDAQDRAPKTYVTVQCPACGDGVDCAMHIRHRSTGGVPTIIATVDGTDLEHHTLTHVDEFRRPAA